MKTLFCTILAYSCMSLAYRQAYCYNTADHLKVVVDKETQEEGFREAARVCYKALSRGKYPGEEAGLNMIDICVNGKRCN